MNYNQFITKFENENEYLITPMYHKHKQSYEPWYDVNADYNTNAKSYMDYLGRTNQEINIIIDRTNKNTLRDVNVENSESIKMDKNGNWFSEDKKDYNVILSSEVILSQLKETMKIYDTNYTLNNSIHVNKDGIMSTNYKPVLEDHRKQIVKLGLDLDVASAGINAGSRIILMDSLDRELEESTSDWINRHINKIKYGTILFTSAKEYRLDKKIELTNSDICLDFNNSVITNNVELDYFLDIHDCHNVLIKNVFPIKLHDTEGSFARIKNCTSVYVENVRATNTGFNYLFNLFSVSKSVFTNVNVSNSNKTKKGQGFTFNACVNVNVISPILSYFKLPFRMTNYKDPVANYMNEGISLMSPITLKSDTGLYNEMCTSLAVINPIFDFNSIYGIYCYGGTNINISNFWIGLQDGGTVGIEVNDAYPINTNNGTIAGNWSYKGKQKAFFAHTNVNWNIDNVYMIDIDGGVLEFENIKVRNDSYFQNEQKQIVRRKSSDEYYTFFGIKSINNPLAVVNSYFEIYSFDERKPSNFIKSSGYVNNLGVAHVNKIEGTTKTIHTITEDGFNISFRQDTGDEDVSYYRSSIIVRGPEKRVVRRTV